MTERQKVAHVLRRYGLGAGHYELERYAPLGVEGTLDRLLNFEKTPDGVPVDPYEFTVYEAGLIVDPPKFAAWWCLNMLLTERPLLQKLSVFSHDHFAVSAAKVFDGASMAHYLAILQAHSAGNFRTLTHQIATSGAMIFYLDTQTSTKEKPNENFARELLELFTMGSGYTEADIQQAARTFCGWGLHFSGLGTEEPFEKQVLAAARQKRSIFNFCYVPALSDDGEKKLLGKVGPFNGHQAIDLALDRPECPRFVTGKLAEWFLGRAPSARLNETLAKRFAQDYEVRPVLKLLAESDEFWQPQTVYKSPVDFTVGIFRSLNVQSILRSMVPADRDPWSPMRPEIRGSGEGLLFLMSQQGMIPFYPPNVGGWEWGKAWVTASNIAARINLAQQVFVGDDPNRPLSAWIAARIREDFKPGSDDALAEAFLKIFDGTEISDAQRRVVTEAATKGGGVAALGNLERSAGLLSGMGRALFAAPEFQLI